ncbi:MAG: DUF5677 domain-containing protein [Bacilli bacterium]
MEIDILMKIFDNLLKIRLNSESDIDEKDIHDIFLLAAKQANSLLSEGNNDEIQNDQALFYASTLLDFCIGEYKFLKRMDSQAKIDNVSIASKALEKFAVLKDSESATTNITDFTNYYDPEISTLRTLEKYVYEINTPLCHTNPSVSLINDIFQTVIRKIAGFCKMMSLGLYPDSFVSWRTLHESECILSLLISGGDKVRYSYVKHIAFNNAYRNQSYFSKEALDQSFEVIKSEMRQHDLKSKDMKKFIEYGYLYDHPLFDANDPTLKLNFRDGLERLAGLSEYSKVYEGASEIAHSSSAFFYVNDDFCRDLSLSLTYQSAIRIFNLYVSFMSAYFQMQPAKKEKVLQLLEKTKEMSEYLSSKVNIAELNTSETEEE